VPATAGSSQGASRALLARGGSGAGRVQVRRDGDSRKLGEILAEQIENEIISSGWPVGAVLGSEAELIERYGVSRAVFREAMKIVNHHRVAEMRRGPGGGLVVIEPDLNAVIRAVALHLEFARIGPGQVHETRQALEVECARVAAERIDPSGVERLQRLLAIEEESILATRRRGRERGHLASQDFHLLLAELTGNPAMHLFVRTICLVLADQTTPVPSLEQAARDVHLAHAGIAEAVIAGDADRAQRRMLRHLQAVAEYEFSPQPPHQRWGGITGRPVH
jgi:DNA-binding FadR family transcriptional regulator